MAIRYTKSPEQISKEFFGSIKTGQQMIDEIKQKNSPKPYTPALDGDNQTPHTRQAKKAKDVGEKSIALSGTKALLGVRVDQALIDAMKALPGKHSHHVEQALLEYLQRQE